MARIARRGGGLAHHVTQRGNRREPVFFEADHYRLYRPTYRHRGAAPPAQQSRPIA
jgi:hypothetical protein